MDAIFPALDLDFGLDDAVSTILTVIHHIDQAGDAVLEHVEVMADQVGLDERLLLGHGSELNLLDTHELVVLILGDQQVGQVGDGFDRGDLGGGQTLLTVVDHARLELAELTRHLFGGEVDRGIHIRTVLGHANHRTAGADRDLDDGRAGVGGVLLIAQDDIGGHGLDVEHFEGFADLLIDMRTQSIGDRGLATGAMAGLG